MTTACLANVSVTDECHDRFGLSKNIKKLGNTGPANNLNSSRQLKYFLGHELAMLHQESIHARDQLVPLFQ